MYRNVLLVLFLLVFVNARGEYFDCFGMSYTSEELADMSDPRLKTVYCEIASLRVKTAVRGIGVPEDFRRCGMMQQKVLELLRLKKVGCSAADR